MFFRFTIDTNSLVIILSSSEMTYKFISLLTVRVYLIIKCGEYFNVTSSS